MNGFELRLQPVVSLPVVLIVTAVLAWAAVRATAARAIERAGNGQR